MTEYSVIFMKKIKFDLKHVLLLTYNSYHIQRAYTLWRIAEDNFEAKTKLLGLFVKMTEYSVIFCMLTKGLTEPFFIHDVARLVLATSLLIL